MFRKVLIANRGEIAVRIARTCRKLGVRTVAVHSTADANALHVQVTDEAVHIGPNRLQESYLDRAALLRAVESSGADAVHPGYGLLSEDPIFAREVAAAGARFIGPSPSALEVFGDKVRARQLAAQLSIAVPPGTPQPVEVDDPQQLEEFARGLGYPVMVKAAAGGGGIGMTIVEQEAALLRAVRSCSDRSRAAFADPRVYIERYLSRSRHIEVQVLAAQGEVFALGERECSVQRRHQKIVEESPSPAAFMTPQLRSDIQERAKRLIAAADYEGAATVEFIVDGSEELPEPYFLEVNARLQVEHPVTELVTGLDLVELQLRAASKLHVDVDPRRWPGGHAIEVRIYAEDPEKQFLPQPGTLGAFSLPTHAHVRVDTGYQEGDTVTPFYDPLLAKLIVWGEDRPSALERLQHALDDARIELQGPKGMKRTNLEFLRRVTRAPAFCSGQYDTRLVGEMVSG